MLTSAVVQDLPTGTTELYYIMTQDQRLYLYTGLGTGVIRICSTLDFSSWALNPKPVLWLFAVYPRLKEVIDAISWKLRQVLGGWPRVSSH